MSSYRMSPNVMVKIGTSDPETNADFVGQIYVDTDRKRVFIAVATGTGADDWQRVSAILS